METYVLKFGKHKGKMFKEVDPQYLNWMLQSETIYDSVKANIRQYIDSNNITFNDTYVFTFGKYKGKTFDEADKDYLQWLLNNPKTYDNLKQKIQRYINKSTEEINVVN